MNHNSSKARKRGFGAGGGVEAVTTTSWQNDRESLESAIAADAMLFGSSADEISVPKNVRKNPFQYTIAFNSKIFPHVVKL